MSLRITEQIDLNQILGLSSYNPYIEITQIDTGVGEGIEDALEENNYFLSLSSPETLMSYESGEVASLVSTLDTVSKIQGVTLNDIYNTLSDYSVEIPEEFLTYKLWSCPLDLLMTDSSEGYVTNDGTPVQGSFTFSFGGIFSDITTEQIDNNDIMVVTIDPETSAMYLSALSGSDAGVKTIPFGANQTVEVSSLGVLMFFYNPAIEGSSSIQVQGKYLKDSNGNRFSPIVSAETVYLEDGTNVSDMLDDKENSSNKVTSISSSSTDTQYPSAKCVYNLIGNIESLLSEV